MYHKRSIYVEGFATAALGRERGLGVRAQSCGEQVLSVNNVLISGLGLGFYIADVVQAAIYQKHKTLVDVKD